MKAITKSRLVDRPTRYSVILFLLVAFTFLDWTNRIRDVTNQEEQELSFPWQYPACEAPSDPSDYNFTNALQMTVKGLLTGRIYIFI